MIPAPRLEIDLEKIHHNADQIIRTEGYYLEDARIVVVSYGCTARSARHAVRAVRAKGLPVGLLRLVSIWPFPEETVRELARSTDQFIVAEMNLGQMIDEVQRCIEGRAKVVGVNRVDGDPITPENILEKIREVA